MPHADEALAGTGYLRATITPFGATQPWLISADERPIDTTASIGGGAHGVSITIEASSLIAPLGATPSDITEQRS
jgi:Cys-tRNA(Pro)/Cys-tRNA(Cys) deacylase